MNQPEGVHDDEAEARVRAMVARFENTNPNTELRALDGEAVVDALRDLVVEDQQRAPVILPAGRGRGAVICEMMKYVMRRIRTAPTISYGSSSGGGGGGGDANHDDIVGPARAFTFTPRRSPVASLHLVELEGWLLYLRLSRRPSPPPRAPDPGPWR